MLNGNEGSGTLDIPEDTSFGGLSDVSLEYVEVLPDRIIVRVTPAQAQTILDHSQAFLNRPIRFLREALPRPALRINSIEGVPEKEQLRINFDLLTQNENIETLNNILDTAQQIFIPKGSTFLGIEGVQLFDIVDIEKQSGVTTASIYISTIGYDGDALARTISPFNIGRFIIGNFSIGGPGVVSDINDETAAALRQNGQYSYKLLWSYMIRIVIKLLEPLLSLYI